MLPSDIPISGHALALLASSFRPVTADHSVPGFAWNGGLCVMPGTRNNPPAKPGALEFVSRSKRLNGVANAAPRFLGHLTVAS